VAIGSLAAFIVVGILCLPAAALSQATDFETRIQEGVIPRMTPSDVAALGVSAARRQRARVVSVECTDGTEFRSAYSDPGMRNGGPVWIVRMTEERIDERERRGGSSGAATWLSYVVDDATGELLAVARPARTSDAPHLDRLESGP
jgi:hypothetical protein